MKIKFLIIIIYSFLLFTNKIEAQDSLKQRPKVGLVLSGGGAKGLAHIGVLKVIEEAGIPIDYIGGTSMGSIVGGLYAIGYSARCLDSIVRTVDWDDLLSDEVPRRSLTMIEKDENVKYLFAFPIRGSKIVLPPGMVTGQNISRLFSYLTSPVYNIKDFSKFKIPYLCVATDVENSAALVLKEGVLADAMRASMAIPTVFTPEEIDGHLLLDGGLVNNFPVEEVKKMGADIIIGVNVGFKYYKKEELNSLMKIVEQSVFMHTREENELGKKMCSILITPDMTGYNTSSFNKADSLITRGEKAARQQYDTIQKLAAYLQSFTKPVNTLPVKVEPLNEFYVKRINIYGLKDIPNEFIIQKLPFEVFDKVYLSDIDKYVEMLYGTCFFDRVTYRLEPFEDGVALNLNILERNTNLFKVGLHYDSDFKASLFLNTTFHNTFFPGSKISLDFAIGENPGFTGLLYKNTGWDPRHYIFSASKLVPDFGLRIRAHNMELFQYKNDQRTASYNFTNVNADLFLQANLSNNNAFNLGVMSDFTSLSNRINYSRKVINSYYFNLYGLYEKDSYEQAYYPSRGARTATEVKFVKNLSDDVQADKGFIVVSFRSNVAIPLGTKFTLNQGLFGGTTIGDSVPGHYQFFLGGLGRSYLRGSVPFVGMDFLQKSNRHAVVARLDLQWQAWKDNFFMIKANVGKIVAERKNLFTDENMAVGYGLAYGYRSPIGPMELTVMSSNKNPGLSFFVNIGYWF